MASLDLAVFRERFPTLASLTDAQIQGAWTIANCYITDCGYGRLSGDCLQLALEYMTAHLLFLQNAVIAGTGSGILNSSTIDKISVTLQQMPAPNQWRWWLGHSPFGQNLLALLTAKSVGGFSIGGSPERFAFRKVGGVF